MVKKIILSIVLIMLAVCTTCAAEPLAEKLPESTALYMEVDVENFLDNVETYVKFIDEDLGSSLTADVKELHECLKELAAMDEFAPEILDNLHTSIGYLVLLRRAEPIVTTRTIKVPDFSQENTFHQNINEDTGEYDEAPRWNYIDKEITETSNYSFSFVIETTPEIAQNFLEEVVILLDYLTDKEPDENYEYQEIDVDAGRMIKTLEEDATFGYLDNYIVISIDTPDDLWVLLHEPAEPNLTETNLNKRYSQDNTPSLGRLLTNVGAFVEYGEDEMLKNLEEVRKAAEDEEAENPNASYNMASYKLIAAERVVKTFELFKAVFSIDRLRYAGFNSTFINNEDLMRSDARISLEIEPPFATGLASLLDGGAQLQPPQLDSSDSFVIMSRLGIREIYEEIIKNLEPKIQQSFLGIMMMMKMQIGYDLSDLLPQLAGDSYLYIDIEEKEYKQSKWNPETEEIESVTVVGPLPKFMLLQGLNDPEAFAETFSNLFTRLVATPQAAQYIRKTVYQETDVYIVGPDAGKLDVDPDGLNNYAIVAIDRYLSTGSWEDITELIRRVKAAERPDAVLSQVVEKYPDSNLLVYLSEGFQRKFQKINSNNQADQEEYILNAIDEMDLGIEDPELIERIKTGITKIYKDMILFNEKALPFVEDIVFHGELKDNFYEIRSRTEISKD